MEKLTDFFKDLKERFSSPLFSSFILTWLIFNWKIVIGLLLYKSSELKIDGYVSYIDLIKKNSNANNFLLKPLIAAIIYTFLFPFIRSAIVIFNAWIKSKTVSKSLSAAKSGSISIGKYIELRDVYHKRTELLDDVLKNDSRYIKENEQLKNENLQLTSQLNEEKNKLSKWQLYNNPSYLNGNWVYVLKWPQNGSETPIRKLFISNGTYRFTDQNNHDDIFTQSFLVGNPDSKMIFVSIKPQPNTDKNDEIYYVLREDDSFNRLVGHDNLGHNIIFERNLNER